MQIELTEQQIAMVRDGKRTRTKMAERQRIYDPSQVYELVKHIATVSKEHVMVITLDKKNGMIGVHEVSVGTIDASLVHPREVFRVAILASAAKFILVHNHPSRDLHVSEDDLLVTKRLVTAGKIIGIPLLDHVIVGGDSFHSMQRNGELPS